MLASILALRPARSIAEVIAVMVAIDQALPDDDGVKWFNRLYLRVTRAVENAQKKVEERNFDIRKHLLEYDDAPAGRGFGSGFPFVGCGEDEPYRCFGLDHWFEEVFVRSDTAMAVISAIPVLVLFLFLQKYIVGGLTAGAVKG